MNASCAVILLLTALPALAASKKKPMEPQTKAILRQVLDGAQDKVAACVLDGAPSAKWTVVVKVKLQLNAAGQIFTLDVAVTPAAEKTRACVEGVIRGLTYPKSGASLINAEREWTFSSQ